MPKATSGSANWTGLEEALKSEYKRLRQRLGLSDFHCAALSGVSQSSISRWLKGSHSITIRRASALLSTLEAKLNELQ